jgi:Putative beta barrel porin-7 (BBP7)
MRKGFLTLLGFLVAGAGVSLAQSYPGNLAFPPSGPPENPAPVPPAASPTAPVVEGDFFGIPATSSDAAPTGNRFWFAADYLLWWTKKGPLPAPLVTTGSADANIIGGLTEPDTRILFGGSDQDYGTTSGMRFSAGLWLDCDRNWGVEAGYFQLERRSTGFSARSDPGSNLVLAQPLLAPDGSEFTEIVALPQFINGGIAITTQSRLLGWEINGVANAFRTNHFNFDLLTGFRALNLDETLQVASAFSSPFDQFLNFQTQSVNSGSTLTTFDGFHAQNHFYGGQMGGRLEWSLGPLTIGALGKVALGDNQELVQVVGSSTLIVPNGAALPVTGTSTSIPVTSSTTVPGGVLAQTSNIGDHFRNRFAVVPELGLQVSYQITSCLEAHVGYSVLYWSKVVRPGNQVDRTVEAGLVPTDPLFGTATGTRPAFPFHTSDYWAQGVNFGIGLRF